MPVAFVDLARTCAPDFAVETIAAVVSLESNFQPFAIRINSGPPLADQPETMAEAIEAATVLIADHQDIQLGLGGLGLSELSKLDLTVSDAFDACRNLKATATLLDSHYRLALRAGATSAEVERVMLQSFYGRGDASVGAMVKYDEQVRREAKRLSAKLTSLAVRQEAPERDQAASAVTESDAVRSEKHEANESPWDVFTSGRKASVLVYRNDQQEQYK
ncbi:transglycosylase SLT domain-containing protein [Sinorhizobium numidicum]|uniref:Transglycosylase SLT domain-containing protein n=1 Tax=Sinorhizobium numidicum TaxID=680248 RepID=A0ABY8CSX8_9HYPH|nr:transglycosylase SLT domain-containing protein [Sinorhizobium numidicum]WEX75762.1 transglycosylase SLT domain-containing protein [Sinorhizobium numidicum]WEX81749.1 transglycosylase SLT domain-containing protein [Sinorhizobium numidicum]